MQPLRLTFLTALATLAAAAPATAATAWHSWSLFNGKAAVEGGTGTHSARLSRIVLPDSFKVRKHATKLTFGRVGACKSTGAITPKLVFSTATTAAGVLAQQLTGGTTYGVGTRGDAVYRVAKFSGGSLKGIYVRPTRIAQTWIVVQATTTPHGNCHIGGIRESLGFPLTDAFGTVRASGF
jgi:hypothetical protein